MTSNPTAVIASSVATLGATPLLNHWMESDRVVMSNLRTVKLINLFLYFFCIFATQQPGRIDGRAGTGVSSEQAMRKSDLNKKDLTVNEMMSLRRQSLFVPSGWAFAIWGVIFLGELIFVSSSALLVQEGSMIAPLYKKVSVGFALAQICQTLWTQAFRPHIYKGNLIYLSSMLLSGIAYSLNVAHAQFALASSELVKWYEYVLYFFPITLHFGWTLAASLVNWNGNVAFVAASSSPRWVALAGHASTLVATGLGVGLTVSRRAPVLGCVVAWALTGIASEMNRRLSSLQQQDDTRPRFAWKVGEPQKQQHGMVDDRVQKWLSRFGAALSFSASIYVVVTST